MAIGDSAPFIVVGVDGSEEALVAVEFAAAEATARRLALRVVYAGHGLTAGGLPSTQSAERLRERDELVLTAAELRIRPIGPELAVDLVAAPGTPDGALVDSSAGASLLVVGRRSEHGVGRRLNGSTTSVVAAKAACPLVSVPPSWCLADRAQHVVVGVDGSRLGQDALAFAFEMAHQRGSTLMAVQCWEVPRRWYTEAVDLGHGPGDWLERAELGLAEDLAGWGEQFPDVSVVRVVERAATPADALARRAVDAALLVVGSRGRGGAPGVPLGWTARNVLANASCPVVIVHHGDTGHEALGGHERAVSRSAARPAS